MKFDFKEFAKEWPSPFISRSEIEKFTGGALKKHTLATLDSSKKGISPRFRLNRNVFYRIEDVVK